MDDIKRSERGFERVGHFFLSGSCPDDSEAAAAGSTTTGGSTDKIVQLEGGMSPARSIETAHARGQKADVDHADSRSNADAPAMHREVEQCINRVSRAYDCIGSTVASLHVLKRSCQGVTITPERGSHHTVWFQGAAAIIQEVLSSLSEMIEPDEKEAYRNR